MSRILLVYATILLSGQFLYAQDANLLIQKVRAKMEQVNSYEADGIMKTNVSFLKVPETQIKIYYKKPDKLKIKNEKGISLVPKSFLGISLNSLLKGNFTALNSGTDQANGKNLRIIKLIPSDDNSPVVLSTLYIDVSNLLIIKAKITTRENGTYDMDMDYGKYTNYALPDKIICTFNTKDYKLPKGITLDYDDGSKKDTGKSQAYTKGKVEIDYSFYAINKAISDNIF